MNNDDTKIKNYWTKLLLFIILVAFGYLTYYKYMVYDKKDNNTNNGNNVVDNGNTNNTENNEKTNNNAVDNGNSNNTENNEKTNNNAVDNGNSGEEQNVDSGNNNNGTSAVDNNNYFYCNDEDENNTKVYTLKNGKLYNAIVESSNADSSNINENELDFKEVENVSNVKKIFGVIDNSACSTEKGLLVITNNNEAYIYTITGLVSGYYSKAYYLKDYKIKDIISYDGKHLCGSGEDNLNSMNHVSYHVIDINNDEYICEKGVITKK